MERAALLSVSNREGLVDFAQGLVGLGYKLLTTSGSGRFLSENGIASLSIEKYTGQKEIMDGRVKTLHPHIYAGLLARRDNVEDMEELERNGILPIDVAAVNLYPFSFSTSGKHSPDEMVELIDVGGPSMIRAAAKNHAFVFPVIDPTDYPVVIEALKEKESCLSLRRSLAVKVFASLAKDAVEIASYFSSEDIEDLGEVGAGEVEQVRLSTLSVNPANVGLNGFKPVVGLVMARKQALRYGENPHQRGAFYVPVGTGAERWKQLSGKELSYNNILDTDSVVRMLVMLSWDKPTAFIVKHANPCGVSTGDTLAIALKNAKRCDPRSHFGGIIGFTQSVTAEVAKEIQGDFAEVVVAPSYDDEALALLKGNKNLRIIAIKGRNPMSGVEVRSALDGLLVQERDRTVSCVSEAKIATAQKPTECELQDLALAWLLTAHVKSNAIVIVKDGMLVGVGAGQMSRVDSVELAIKKAKDHGHNIDGAVAASDAFFPFPDGLETLGKAGIKSVVAPGGAKRDAQVIEAANALGMSLLFAVDRHFRH